MARYNHDRDSAVDTESDVDALASPAEDTPLLPTDLPADVVPSKAFQRRAVAMCILILVILETCQFLCEPPTQEIMEDIICRSQFPDHRLAMADPRCKDKEVQKTLAMVRSWTFTVESLIPLLVQLPYGIIADKYGRRPVLCLCLLGIVGQMTWTVIVLNFPDTFSVWASIYGRISYLVGGGGPMVGAMLYTIVSDVVPVSQRTGAFFLLNATGLILNALLSPVAGALMSIDPWLSLWIGYGAVLLGLVAAPLVPETLWLRKKADDKRRHDEATGDIANPAPEADELTRGAVAKRAWFAAKNDMGHVLRFVLASRSIMALIIASGFYYPVKIAFLVNLLQYMTKRFSWEWYQATYISTAGSLTSVVVLLVVLPAASMLLTKRYHMGPLSRDLLLSRISIAITVVGCACVSFAAVPQLFVAALVITSLGTGFGVLCRALLNAVVEPHTVGTLNTTIAFMETLMGCTSSPAMGWLFSQSLDLGGVWMGLPYMVTTVFAMMTLVIVFTFRVPKGVAQARMP